MTANTADLSYWLNWRFGLCGCFLTTIMAVAAILIWKYEGSKGSESERRKNQQQEVGFFYEDETWKTCLKGINPAWLLAFRIFALIVLLALITADCVAEGGFIFIFYTQWTFALVTIYFALASSISIYRLCKCCHKSRDNCAEKGSLDSNRCTYTALTPGDISDTSNWSKRLDTDVESHNRQTAGIFCYIFQIVFQTCGGAVVLTDAVFWLIIYPFLTDADFNLDFMIICMHSVNAVFLLGDIFLNCMRFPMFRIAYFALYTCVFVIFQWIVHACVSMWWPYPFLDLSSPYAPIWYMGVGLMHVPCYGLMALIVRSKHSWLSRSFPESYQGFR